MSLKKFILYPYYNLYALAITLFVVGLSIIFGLYTWHTQKMTIRSCLPRESHRIDELLRTIFDETRELTQSLGQQIAKSSDKSDKAIQSMLNNKPEAIYHIGADTQSSYTVDSSVEFIYYSSVHKLPSWRRLGWLPPHNTVAINSNFGKKPQEINLSHRTYIAQSQANPWTLHFSAPAVGVPSGLWEIPAGMGVTDDNGQYLGTLSLGFNITELNVKLQREALKYETSFIVLDENYKVVLQSTDNAIDLKTSYYRDILSQYPLSTENEEYLQPIYHNGIAYLYYQKIQDYPYIVLTGFQENILRDKILDIMLPRLFELIIMGVLCLFILYFFRTHILSLAQACEQARQDFLQDIKTKIESGIRTVSFLDKIQSQSAQNKDTAHEQLINLIHESGNYVHSLSKESLDFTKVDIAKTIDDVLLIHSQNAFIKHIRIIKQSSFNRDIPPLYTDELCLKQVLLALIALSLDFTPRGGTLLLSCQLQDDETLSGLNIIIEDNGIVLSREGILRLQRRLTSPNPYLFIDQINLRLETIEKLISLLNGFCSIEPKESFGKIIKLSLPYRVDDNLREFKSQHHGLHIVKTIH